jgi:hypothetical protein
MATALYNLISYWGGQWYYATHSIFFKTLLGIGLVAFLQKMPTVWFVYVTYCNATDYRIMFLLTSIDSIFCHETGHMFGVTTNTLLQTVFPLSSHGKVFFLKD